MFHGESCENAECQKVECVGSGGKSKSGGKQELYLNDLTSSVSIKIAPVIRG